MGIISIPGIIQGTIFGGNTANKNQKYKKRGRNDFSMQGLEATTQNKLLFSSQEVLLRYFLLSYFGLLAGRIRTSEKE